MLKPISTCSTVSVHVSPFLIQAGPRRQCCSCWNCESKHLNSRNIWMEICNFLMLNLYPVVGSIHKLLNFVCPSSTACSLAILWLQPLSIHGETGVTYAELRTGFSVVLDVCRFWSRCLVSIRRREVRIPVMSADKAEEKKNKTTCGCSFCTHWGWATEFALAAGFGVWDPTTSWVRPHTWTASEGG